MDCIFEEFRLWCLIGFWACHIGWLQKLGLLRWFILNDNLKVSTGLLIFFIFNTWSELRLYSEVCSEHTEVGLFADVPLVLSCVLGLWRPSFQMFYWILSMSQRVVAKLTLTGILKNKYFANFYMVHCSGLRFCFLILCTSVRVSSLRDKKSKTSA